MSSAPDVETPIAAVARIDHDEAMDLARQLTGRAAATGVLGHRLPLV